MLNLPENIDSLKILKSELQTNYTKFFKSAFADRDFKSKWQKWESFRNKIAHANLFTNKDLIEGEKIAVEIIEIITDAENSPTQPKITQIEREAVQEQIIAHTNYNESDEISTEIASTQSDTPLTEDEFLKELQTQEEFYSNRTNGFVGAVRFLRFHLAELGHKEDSAQKVLDILKAKKMVEIYYVDNPNNSSTKTAAIKTSPPPSFASQNIN